MKTPDEIKKGLECRKMGYSEKCNRKCNTCAAYVPSYSIANIYADALAYIQQLERERDALLKDLKFADGKGDCWHCKHMGAEEWETFCYSADCECAFCESPCKCRDCRDGSAWEWRGVKETCAGASDGCTGASGA